MGDPTIYWCPTGCVVSYVWLKDIVLVVKDMLCGNIGILQVVNDILRVIIDILQVFKRYPTCKGYPTTYLGVLRVNSDIL